MSHSGCDWIPKQLLNAWCRRKGLGSVNSREERYRRSSAAIARTTDSCRGFTPVERLLEHALLHFPLLVSLADTVEPAAKGLELLFVPCANLETCEGFPCHALEGEFAVSRKGADVSVVGTVFYPVQSIQFEAFVILEFHHVRLVEEVTSERETTPLNANLGHRVLRPIIGATEESYQERRSIMIEVCNHTVALGNRWRQARS